MTTLPAAKITDRLYLSDATVPNNERFLSVARVTLVVNCTKTKPFPTNSLSEIEYVRVPVDDKLRHEDCVTFLRLLPDTIQRMKDHAHRGGTTLVHCHAGRQRSACLVAAFLMFENRWSMEKAIGYVQQRRPVAFKPSVNFRFTLERWEQELSKLDS